MKSKAFSRKKIEKAVMEINMYYDKYPTGRYIDKKYLVVKGIVGNDEIDAFISRLVGLGLIEYSRNNNYDQLAITRLPKCMAYFEKKNDAASQVAFAKRTSIISIIISGLSFIVVFLNFVLQNFVTK